LLLVVRHVDERHAEVALERLEEHLHLLPELEVERTERLVEQQHARPVDDRPRERDALALAARELRRLPPGVAFEPHRREHLLDRTRALGAPGAPAPEA